MCKFIFSKINSKKDLYYIMFCFCFFVCVFLEHVIVLEATDDFLTQRVQGLPHSNAEKMLYTQEEFVSRLKTFRQLSTTYDSATDYFDELEIYPDYIGTVLCISLVNTDNF